MTSEKLIAEARAFVSRGWFSVDYPTPARLIRSLADSLEAAEKARTSTDDERADPTHDARDVAGVGIDEAGRRSAQTEQAHRSSFVDVVFDGPPDETPGRFVETEDPTGASIRAGEWIDRGDGFWALRIPLADPNRD